MLSSGNIDNLSIDLLQLILGLCLSTVYAILLGFMSRFFLIGTDYKKSIKSLLLLIPTVLLIISIIKSSLALSLGLVGALSIVRFRAPIKDPEELMILFLAIAAGIGLGASQFLATSISLFFIIGAVSLHHLLFKNVNMSGYFLSISLKSETDEKWGLSAITKAIESSGIRYNLRKFSDSDGDLSAVFHIAPSKNQNIEALKDALKNDLKGEVSINFVSNDL